ncbi:MAG: hypothetical protein SFX72_06185 [Isosphaeraceae bacterium]|nr:hypothetical protein [Isosphaeraceae bacterium]
MTLLLLASLLLAPAATPGSAEDPAPKAKPANDFELVTLTGEVDFLADVLSRRGLTPDRKPIAEQVVLVEKDGAITPMLSDDASRAFFLDDRVRRRKTEVVARRYRGLAYLQVVTFRIEDEGRLRTPEYYCEICSISVRFPQDCPCCQGPLIFRMKPDER